MSTAIEQLEQTPRESTWIEDAVASNPNTVLELNPDDPNEIIIDTTRNSRGYTPPIGDKSLKSLVEQIIENGQQIPSLATINENGVASLYAGFRRARAVQTIRQANPDWKLRVIVTPTVMSELDVFRMSLSENVFREDMTVMQRVGALKFLVSAPNNMTLKAASRSMNMSIGAASTYLRFEYLPPVATKALNSGAFGYTAGAKLVAMLPKVIDPDDAESVAALEKVQAKIAKIVEKELVKGGGKGTAEGIDRATRKVADSTGSKPANQTQRRAKLILTEIDEFVEKVPEAERAESYSVVALEAFKRYVNGGSMKALIKVLEGQ